MIDLKKAERSLRLTGAVYDRSTKIGAKIVEHGDGFGVETTVDGDRRLPVEEPLPLEEAIRLAVAQLMEPRSRYEYVPSKDDSKPSPSRDSLPYRSVGDLAVMYREHGLDRQAAWKQYICDTVLQRICKSETVDAREFFAMYDLFSI